MLLGVLLVIYELVAALPAGNVPSLSEEAAPKKVQLLNQVGLCDKLVRAKQYN